MAGIGLFLLLFTAADYLGQNPDDVTGDVAAAIGGLLVLDLVLGVVAVCLLPLRRHRPLLISVLTACLSAVSASSIGAAALALVSLSTRRRWKPVLAIGGVWVASTLFYELVLRQSVPSATIDLISSWASGGLALAVYAICATTGFYIGARRELLASLRDRAETAEREQALREDSAREAERTRIAREMHDVLAHHISLVSLHAGALTYRTDLTRDETAEAASVIQNNAQLALTELRQILGVLRSGGDGEGDRRAEPPQPTLEGLPALVADSREAGMRVTLDMGGLHEHDERDVEERNADRPPAWSALAGLPESVSRTAYRIIQETLTNARKHATGEAVTVRLQKEQDHLCIEVENRLTQVSAASAAPAVPARDRERHVGSGVGLTGLQERAVLAGGSIMHGVTPDNRFMVSVRLPWV